MKLEPHEAIGLLRGWQSDNRIVHAKFVDSADLKEHSCSIVGLIRDIYPTELRIVADIAALPLV